MFINEIKNPETIIYIDILYRYILDIIYIDITLRN